MPRRSSWVCLATVAGLASVAVGALLSCAPTPSPMPASLVETRSPLQLAADTTRVLATEAAESSDTADAQARIAATARSLDDALRYMTSARLSAQNANRQASSALVKGDWVQHMLAGAGEDAEQPQYDHYWQMGRAKLDVVRLRSGNAVTAADSALACTVTTCTATRALRMQTEIEAAAGAAREAESLIRIALVHVPR
jgi:hypothetical protein